MTSIAERARQLKGVPFVHQGRDENGIDCVGFAAYVIGYPMDKLPPYPRDPLNNQLETMITAAVGPPLLVKSVAPITIDLLREGDIVGMQYKGPVRHVGIVIPHIVMPGVLSLIHTDSMVEKVTEHILDFKWLRRIEYVWRLEFV